MLRSHHHLRGFVKLVLWDVYCVNGCGSFRLGYVGVGFGENCDCGYGILYAPMLGWILRVWLFWHLLLILRSFMFPAGVGLPSRFCYVFVCVGPAHLVFLWERERVCEM
jgi:hypothetical protein